MRFQRLSTIAEAARKGRDALRRSWPPLALRRRVAGRFQIYNHTLPDRYPWLFGFAAEQLAHRPDCRILSFGCSRGEEVFSLRRYLPGAAIKGVDIDPRNIRACRARAIGERSTGLTFGVAASTADEPADSYDAIFCLAVLCLGDLTTSRAQRCDPWLHFAEFERVVTDFGRCLKPGGLLLLHTSNFRFCDAAVAEGFEVVLEADPTQLAPDVLFDRHDRLMPGVRYPAVGFRKHRA
jgi:SAM-dependent methyltransferase